MPLTMRLPLLGLLTLLGALCTPHCLAVGDFALIDERGEFHQISRYAQYVAVVIVVHQPNSPGQDTVKQEIARLRNHFADAPIVFLQLNPDVAARRNAEALLSFADADRLPLLLDSAQVVARQLGATVQGEAFMIEPSRLRLLYRGALSSDQLAPAQRPEQTEFYLQTAIDALMAGETIMEQGPLPDAAPIVYPYLDVLLQREISYEQEIAPLLIRRCAHCHVAGGLAPWAMESYLMIRGWSPMMRETVITRRMPPGQLDGQVGESWRSSHELPDEEMALLLHWIDQGAQRPLGEADPLPDRVVPSVDWVLGEPDLIIEVPEQAVPANGVVDFIIKRSHLALDRDRWVKAVAYNVGARDVLHSLLLFVFQPPDDTPSVEDMIHPDHAQFISLYVPGEASDVFREDSGFLLPVGSDLTFKLRYTTSGRAVVDSTRIGLYFHDMPPAMVLESLVLSNDSLRIPPNSTSHREFAESEPLPVTSSLESFSPHSHARGKAIRLIARHTDGRRELLTNVANYNFNWQLAYRVSERKVLPAGTVLEAETNYDNSPSNLFITDFDREIGWGVSDNYEMFNHYVRLAVPRIGL